MKILLIEDETPAAKRLSQLILKFRPNAQILEVIDSVEGAVKWLNTFETPDLLFLDIQLSDGLSFDIFTQTEIQAPIIFTTAFDQFTLKAFKVNSIDYLLKPIDPQELEKALKKYDHLFGKSLSYDPATITNLLKSIVKKNYKTRFLVKSGQQLSYISVKDIAYFYSEDGVLCTRLHNGKRHLLDYTLDQLEDLLEPDQFFRINRKIITHINAIHKIHTYFNSRLKVELLPKTDFEAIVSRDRVGGFKDWLDR